MALPARGVLETRSTDHEHVIALYNPLILGYFSRPPRSEELDLLRAVVHEARAQAIPGGMLIAVARRNMAGGIDPRVRLFFEQTVREHSSAVGASAAVVLMEGFAGAMMRGFIASLLLLSGK